MARSLGDNVAVLLALSKPSSVVLKYARRCRFAWFIGELRVVKECEAVSFFDL